MANIKDIRRTNARRLAQEAGGPADFARKVGFTDTRVSQLIGKNFTRNIGDRAAKMIEDAFKLSEGWLDTEKDPEPESASVSVREETAEYGLRQSDVNLVWVTAREMALLSKFRESTMSGMVYIEIAADTSEKDVQKIRSIKTG